MGLRTKFQTAAKVVETFGPLELARLAVRKLGIGKTGEVAATRPVGVQVKSSKDLTNEFYSAVLNTSTPDVIQAREEYKKYQIGFTERLALPRNSFFNPIFDLGQGMSEFIFLCILIKKPHTVIETGVAAGVSTNSILSALCINGTGNLLSLDITDKVGELVDDKLKSVWELEILPDLSRENAFINCLKRNSEATVFLHDSDHSESWQIKEFSNAVHWLPSLQLILFDDISQELIDFILENYPGFQVIVIDENRKYSAIILKSKN
jgi:Methyltransferase domain